MERICLDANALLDLLLQRACRQKVIQLLSGMTQARFCIPALTVDLVLYFVEAENLSKDEAWQFLEMYEIIDLTKDDVDWARDNDGGDFEDALQVACARRVGAKSFATLDKGLESMYGSYLTMITVR